jgi:hypothetical protein
VSGLWLFKLQIDSTNGLVLYLFVTSVVQSLRQQLSICKVRWS